MRSIWKKAIGVAAASAAIAAGGAGLAFADNVVDTVVASQSGIAPTINVGGSFSQDISYSIQETGSNNTTFPATVNFGLTSAPSWVSASAASHAFTGYADTFTVTVSGTAPAGSAGTHSFTLDAATSADNLNAHPAQVSFTVTVNAAAADSTAPSVSYSQSPDGSSGWFKTAPATVTVSAVDADDNVSSINCTLDGSPIALTNTSGIGSSKTASGDVTTSVEGDHTVSCTATDSHSNTTSPAATTHLKLDTVAPTISDVGFKSGTAGTNGWYTSAVTENFSASDATSGPACTTPWTATSTTEGTSVTIPSGTCTDIAGNTAASIDSAPYKIDLTDPTDVAFAGGIADGGSYYFGFVPAVDTCTANDAISGLAGCVVTGYGTSVGSHTLTATATDNAGRTATNTLSYTVLAWTLNGFYSPVDMGGVWNTVKGGSTVPLKFEVFAGSTELTDTSVVDSFKVTPTTCPNGSAPTDAIEFTTTGGTNLRYDTTAGQFIQNWATPKKPGACYLVTMTTDDGSSLSANFQLK